MGIVTHNVRLCRAYKPYSEWLEEDPVLLYGECAFALDVPDYEGPRLKTGDGYHKFSELPWHEDPDALDNEDVGVPGGAVRLDKYGVIPLELIPDELLNRGGTEGE